VSVAPVREVIENGLPDHEVPTPVKVMTFPVVLTVTVLGERVNEAI
jgi:hypothetical protein